MGGGPKNRVGHVYTFSGQPLSNTFLLSNPIEQNLKIAVEFLNTGLFALWRY